MRAVSYAGVTFASLNVWAGWGQQGQGPYRAAVSVRRAGSSPHFAGVSQDVERVTVTLGPKPGFATEATMLAALGALDVLSEEARPFVCLLDDGATTVTRDMAIESWRWVGTNQAQIDFVAGDPLWTETAAETATASGAVSPIQLAHTNQGQATVWPRYRLWWMGQRGTKGSVVGQQYRKRFTLTNNQDRAVAPFPRQVDLGDAAALVAGGKARADGDDLRLIVDGRDLTRQLTGWNLAKTWAWFVVPGLDAGEALTVDVVYGNAAATNPPAWSGFTTDRPAIDLDWETGAATGGTTSTLVRTGAGWQTDEWEGGRLYVLTGPNAGTYKFVSGNTADTLTFTGASALAFTAANTYLLEKSTNQIWNYAVRTTQRDGEYARGRWHLNSASFTPSVVSYEAPASWRPELVYDNRDSFGLRRYTMELVGVTDRDPFALLDARRMWEGNDKRMYEAGTADGVSLVAPMPITTLYWQYLFDNPNGMCQVFVGVRQSGAEDWTEIFVDQAASGGLATRGLGGGASTLFPGVQSDYGDVYQVVMALGPVDDVEIDLDWRRDTGSATSGSTTATVDSTKEWQPDQFDNGTIRMLSGANAGRKRSITGNTGTTISHNAFPTANADGDRYVVTNKRLMAQLKDGDKLVVLLDTSAITASALGAETAVYEASMTLWVGDGPSGDPAGQHRALVGWAAVLAGAVDAADGRRVFLAADERLEIDAARRRIRIWNATSQTYTGELTDPAVVVQWHDGTAWRRSANWLPLGTGQQFVWVEETNMGTLSLEVSYYPAYLGA